jgi:diguanylate cyclase (GGDEF)-like protein
VISKPRLLIAICFVAVHTLLVFSPAGPDSWGATLCVILAALAASFECFRMAAKTSGETRVHWLLLGSSILISPVGTSLFTRAEIVGDTTSASSREAVMLLKASYGAVLLFAVCAIFDSRVARSIRIMSILLSLLAGGIFFSMAYTAVLTHNSNQPADLLFFARVFEAITSFIAVIAALKILTSDRGEARSFFFAASAFLLSALVFPEIRIDLRIRHEFWWSSLFIMPPYLLLFVLAGKDPPRMVRDWTPSALAFSILNHAGSFFVCFGLLAFGLLVSRAYYGLGSTAALLAILCYYLLNVISRYQSFRAQEALLAANQELGTLADLDGLTGIANRRIFDERLESELIAAQRSEQPISLLMIDVDCFKSFNDSFGHPAGDSCLVQVACAFRGALPRATDLVARYGGEEFAVILPSTDSRGARKVAESLQAAVARLAIQHPASPSGMLSVSIGVATADASEHRSPAFLVHAADRALYKAKMLGRNRVECAAISQEASNMTESATESI